MYIIKKEFIAIANGISRAIDYEPIEAFEDLSEDALQEFISVDDITCIISIEYLNAVKMLYRNIRPVVKKLPKTAAEHRLKKIIYDIIIDPLGKDHYDKLKEFLCSCSVWKLHPSYILDCARDLIFKGITDEAILLLMYYAMQQHKKS